MSVRSSSSRSSIGDTQDRRQKYNASVRVGSAMKGRRFPSVANFLGRARAPDTIVDHRTKAMPPKQTYFFHDSANNPPLSIILTINGLTYPVIPSVTVLCSGVLVAVYQRVTLDRKIQIQASADASRCTDDVTLQQTAAGRSEKQSSSA